jgi:hypothetical protein
MLIFLHCRHFVMLGIIRKEVHTAVIFGNVNGFHDAEVSSCTYCDMQAFLGNELAKMLPRRYYSWTQTISGCLTNVSMDTKMKWCRLVETRPLLRNQQRISREQRNCWRWRFLFGPSRRYKGTTHESAHCNTVWRRGRIPPP